MKKIVFLLLAILSVNICSAQLKITDVLKQNNAYLEEIDTVCNPKQITEAKQLLMEVINSGRSAITDYLFTDMEVEIIKRYKTEITPLVLVYTIRTNDTKEVKYVSSRDGIVVEVGDDFTSVEYNAVDDRDLLFMEIFVMTQLKIKMLQM